MILNLNSIENHIVSWIKDYASNAGIKTLIVGLSGGVDSALVALLCQKTRIKTLCIALPCHSSTSSVDKASNFADAYNLPFITLDLTSSYNAIEDQVKANSTLYKKHTQNFDLENKMATGGLRSCLRAPVLSYFALASQGLIVGTGNRSEDKLIRYFQKYGDGCVDISPIGDLFKSEVYELFAHMTQLDVSQDTDGKNWAKGQSAAEDIYNAAPTADLWGPEGEQTDEEELGLTYSEIEWADRMNEKTNLSYGKPIITDLGDPAKHPFWNALTSRQREVVAKIHQMEKITKHKENLNLPVCLLRDEKGIIE